MKRALVIILVLALAVSLLAGCGQNASQSSGQNSEKASEQNSGQGKPQGETKAGKMRIALIVKSTGNPFMEKMADGFKTAVEEGGNEAILKAPDQPTAEAQIQMIEELIAQKVNAIAVSANDPDALQPALQKAMKDGIKVLSLDSAVNAESRMVHIQQADPERIGRIQIQAAYEMIGGEGQIAVLSATSQATNQNTWIQWMKEELKDPKYAKMELVKVAYGDDLRDKSVSETEGLLKSYPNLKAIIAPTTVGIAAAGKVLTDKGLKGKVYLTGLGLPSEMAEYIESGVCPWMYLWNPIDLGYLAGCAANALVKGDITGKAGEKFTAGKLGEREVIQVGDGTEIMLGDPFKFDKSNIEEWKNVY
ncbi:MAG: rhamnose transport system substrate-binding protein [Thermoanaerobacteraceae bacterium]|jgi:rhamnose transport system substrate-binding protein|uniref:Rhamnose ABC transporter substrate-binding protein n=1 Tax=Biomaibacter acetigenes TaxID=2316383 RepID=A0A3G2R3W9_9FIRM|nr:rhamnose ABC transporter substrate-binding protein [Biomaibacter acetigenes]AYO30136.1 rhamnose ABC transporter substrate-binding protein [Biomaibacter acetigenes]MDK2879592.1 rhamnose transport system substrate-binding protein [Thermoanaerobacteraceae bacterium]MDN5311989.1 rhamnose transport system substrate-binding protein [Thermoanaerobacteraceae bacterium]